MRILKARCAFNRPLRLDVCDDALDRRFGVPEPSKSRSHRTIRNRHDAAAYEFLVGNNSQHGFDSSRVAIHHEANRASWSEDGDLRITESVLILLTFDDY